ncbi:hypothetical protein AMAG_07804 [Allomyces macrogynus ATCC 38327]|uniref:Uncharacterized protein n=1 Tax=Allomyces macrogynus (strain ATCC 38327) TaxID=578462 RepID=A0A0L0SJC3_ALLM3|nr:hypothetical protein AMAG_07804 [Allomyces macrogynus ATCC 38327]|eukprot:KNE62601.1 hypothetical protein AMAG_07804 [Allomyces macrogynus ATCC 38327]
MHAYGDDPARARTDDDDYLVSDDDLASASGDGGAWASSSSGSESDASSIAPGPSAHRTTRRTRRWVPEMPTRSVPPSEWAQGPRHAPAPPVAASSPPMSGPNSRRASVTGDAPSSPPGYMQFARGFFSAFGYGAAQTTTTTTTTTTTHGGNDQTVSSSSRHRRASVASVVGAPPHLTRRASNRSMRRQQQQQQQHVHFDGGAWTGPTAPPRALLAAHDVQALNEEMTTLRDLLRSEVAQEAELKRELTQMRAVLRGVLDQMRDMQALQDALVAELPVGAAERVTAASPVPGRVRADELKQAMGDDDDENKTVEGKGDLSTIGEEAEDRSCASPAPASPTESSSTFVSGRGRTSSEQARTVGKEYGATMELPKVEVLSDSSSASTRSENGNEKDDDDANGAETAMSKPPASLQTSPSLRPIRPPPSPLPTVVSRHRRARSLGAVSPLMLRPGDLLHLYAPPAASALGEPIPPMPPLPAVMPPSATVFPDPPMSPLVPPPPPPTPRSPVPPPLPPKPLTAAASSSSASTDLVLDPATTAAIAVAVSRQRVLRASMASLPDTDLVASVSDVVLRGDCTSIRTVIEHVLDRVEAELSRALNKNVTDCTDPVTPPVTPVAGGKPLPAAPSSPAPETDTKSDADGEVVARGAESVQRPSPSSPSSSTSSWSTLAVPPPHSRARSRPTTPTFSSSRPDTPPLARAGGIGVRPVRRPVSMVVTGSSGNPAFRPTGPVVVCGATPANSRISSIDTLSSDAVLSRRSWVSSTGSATSRRNRSSVPVWR